MNASVAAPALLCAGLEVSLNRLLQHEPAALEEIAALAGKRLSLTLAGPEWTLWLEPHHTGVRVLPGESADADVRLRAPTPLLLGTTLSTLRGATGLPAGLSVEGDIELLQHFNRALATAGFEPEEWLSAAFGETAAHRLGELGRRLFDWARGGGATLAYSAAEYLREETGDLARAADVVEWSDAVDALCEAVDRSAARIEHLESIQGSTP
ncbi:MAG: SCP2 sterol-binding domain-containing protein [Gammaproteobacteria bacterium]|nr:SCP2 sterol-binding domain-containing protein [Gammaproteobacteria bacterium]